jgi:hypothetical protein
MPIGPTWLDFYYNKELGLVKDYCYIVSKLTWLMLIYRSIILQIDRMDR